MVDEHEKSAVHSTLQLALDGQFIVFDAHFLLESQLKIFIFDVEWNASGTLLSKGPALAMELQERRPLHVISGFGPVDHRMDK